MTLQDDEIELLKVHLPYELDQLDYAFVVAGSEHKTRQEALHRMMAIDSFYMHSRNLIEFYERQSSKGERSRTACARDFTSTEVLFPSFRDYMSLINDQVTHLNFARGTHANDPLDGKTISEIKVLLDKCLDLFQRNLSSDATVCWKNREEREYTFEANSFNSACTVIYETQTATSNFADSISGTFFKSLSATNDKEVILFTTGLPAANQ